MRLSHCLLVVFWISWICHPAIGQSVNFKEQLQKADNLHRSNQWDKAEEQLDQLLKELEPARGNRLDFKIIAQQLKAEVLEGKNELEEAAALNLEVIENASPRRLYPTAYLAYISLALVQEKSGDLKAGFKSLSKAKSLYQTHQLDSIYANYCLRIASCYRIDQQPDSSFHYATLAHQYAQKYEQDGIEDDANLLLGGLLKRKNPKKSIEHFLRATHRFLEKDKTGVASVMYNNVSKVYFELGDIEQSFVYNDSAFWAAKLGDQAINAHTYLQRANLFEYKNEIDSALANYKKYHEAYTTFEASQNDAAVKEIVNKFENEKEQQLIGQQAEDLERQKRLLLFSLLAVVLLSLLSYLLFTTNRKLKQHAQTVKAQASDLRVALGQQEVLFAEVHHRVNNNLQLVIALLEMQVESASEKNIEELTIESQNRVKSMALLHNVLYDSKDISEVNFQDYLEQLVGYLHQSLSKEKMQIDFDIDTQNLKLDMKQSIPLGLILVELVTNSFKHAFKKREKGYIKIHLQEAVNNSKYSYQLIYGDDGIGMNKSETPAKKGMGMEIIQGLSKQLGGEIEMKQKESFETRLYF